MWRELGRRAAAPLASAWTRAVPARARAALAAGGARVSGFLRRRPETVIAAALLTGVAVMVAHWGP